MTISRRLLIAAATAAVSVAAFQPALAQEAAPTEQAQTQEQMPEGKILPDIVLGQDSAPVTMVEYASFTCPHCAAFHNENLPKLKAEYIDTGKIKFIQRDVYFDAVGLWAGILARCGGDEKYYPVSDMLFEEQKTWLDAKSGDDIAANLRKIGAKAGMTTEQMDACWADKQKVADLVATFQKNATADNVEGTPSFVIGGEKVQNQPWDAMKKIIDAKIAEAEKQG
ncbi:DsbA family protein [Paracoccus shanxieyensis]|uniref:Thioredoxin domain-containing protein n=1 Tax=Paracoccus shanxieyensis TaxID=2675752 RepID=A0A6L6IUK9_9RHOB|nr:DsbA family protein [Paracoccus shanxieyensis]MTH63291.1 thioredoxin domain-containing protein [Paracoccus shanxieyensis]MTH87205.1 thioredoxin domain-containing protein [Paracoccus shanxieyensis]